MPFHLLQTQKRDQGATRVSAALRRVGRRGRVTVTRAVCSRAVGRAVVGAPQSDTILLALDVSLHGVQRHPVSLFFAHERGYCLLSLRHDAEKRSVSSP